ncbi:hypothetical protein KP79_PYT00755 [Mizuhopecten yessoensis]|uniref:Ig-like domain-containing protein n=1 Tax=Mizuhopecten yessoensis TaxID=6573 RepID=A0A210QQV5_MIZYE|nr:hypothetical protein KP79_PYT00755 [Mizuhopecten yessoensis]
MACNQDIPEEAIDLHNKMVKYLDGYIFGDDLIKLKELFKDIPLTPAVMEKISNIYDLFKHLLDNKIISIGSYTKFISNLRLINPNQAAYVEKRERDMQEVIKRDLPVVTIGQTTYSVSTNSQVTLQCSVSANPAITSVVWQKSSGGTTSSITIDGTRYSGGSTTSPTLVINNAASTDSGTYVCRATNSIGTGTGTSITLSVTGSANHVNMASNQYIPKEVIALHNEMVIRLDGYILGDDLIKLKNFFKEIPLTSADMENIHNMYDLFEHLMKNEIISFGSYTKFISNLRQINPYQATYVEKKEREMKEIIKRGNGSGTDENITAEQPQDDIGSNRNSTAEDPDEGDSPAGEKSICKLS